MKRLIALLAALTLCLTLVSCSSNGGSNGGTTDPDTNDAPPVINGGDVVVMMVGTTIAESSAQGLALVEFERYVEEKSEGRIDVQLYLNSTLGDARQLCESIQIDSIQGAVVDGASMSNFDKNFIATDLPFLFDSLESAYAAMDGAFGDALNASAEDYGMLCISYWDNGFRNFSNSKRPIHTPEDMSGLKMRVMEAPLYINLLQAFGANPTPMAFSEVYTGLQQGAVDGQDNGPVLTYTSKFYEVQRYYTVAEYAYCPSPFLVSPQWFNSLDADLQQIILDGVDYAKDLERDLQQELSDTYLQMMIDEGVEVNHLTLEEKEAFRALALPVWDVVSGDISDEIMDIARSLSAEW